MTEPLRFTLNDEQRIAFWHARTHVDPRDGVTVAELVAAVRSHLSRVRAQSRHLRLGHYQGRNGGGSGAFGREQEAELLLRILLDMPDAHKGGSWQRQLYGAVWGEHSLAERISAARDEGQERPELRARQRTQRRELRELIAC